MSIQQSVPSLQICLLLDDPIRVRMEIVRSLFVLSCLGLGASALAITPDYGADSFFVGVGSMGASCVAVAPHWVMTAKHVGGMTVNLNGVTMTAVERNDCPNADIALLRFTETLSTYYTPDFRDMTGRQITMVGFGSTGTAGASGITITGGGGTRRTATNIIDRSNSVTFDNVNFFNSWEVDVDGPTGNGSLGGGRTSFEGGLWGGDSGGGALFLDENSRWRLVGINSYIDDNPGSPNGAYNDYGDLAGFVKLNSYGSWITQRIGPVPEPGTWAALGLGAAALMRRRRK